MASLVTCVCLVLLICGFHKDWNDDVNGFLACAFVVCFIITAVFGGFVINGRTLESKINMCIEENENIEEDINVLVEQYMNYESDTYGNLKNESSIMLISLYPELKADILIEKQIEVYTSNNAKIKELKEKLINISNYKWWLYFGN